MRYHLLVPSSSPSFDSSENLRYYGRFDSSASSDPYLDSEVRGFLARGYSYFGSELSESGEHDVAQRSLQVLYLGQALRGRFDDFSTPQTIPTEGTPDMLLGATISKITGGNTVYIGTFEDRLDQRVSIPVPEGTCVQLNVRSDTAPGSGESFTYAVMKNGSATSMTITVENTSQEGSTSLNQVSCSTGDRISIRLVASAGAATAYHRFSLRYTLA